MPVKDKGARQPIKNKSTSVAKSTNKPQSVNNSDKVKKEFSKTFSDTSLVSGTSVVDIASAVTVWLDIGVPEVNAVFGDPNKGIPGGRIIELYSAEGHGKTTIALQLLSLVQQAGGLAIYGDIEGTYDEEWAAKQGVDVDELLVLQLEEEVKKKKGGEVEVIPEGMEEWFEKLEGVIRVCKQHDPKMPVVIAWDSVAATPTRAELDGEYTDQGYALQARALSKGLRKLNGELRGSGVVLLCINQTRTAIGGFRPYQDAAGGKALKFYSSVRVQVQKTSGRNPRSAEGKVLNRKNKLSPPFIESDFHIDFGKGLLWGEKPKRKVRKIT